MVISDGTKLRVLLVGEQTNEKKEDPQMIVVIDVMEWNQLKPKNEILNILKYMKNIEEQ